MIESTIEAVRAKTMIPSESMEDRCIPNIPTIILRPIKIRITLEQLESKVSEHYTKK